MNQTLELMAKQLASQDRIVEFSPNSVFSAIELTNGSEEQIRDIVTSLSSKIGNDITLIKTKCIPFMNDLAKAFKEELDKYEVPTELSTYKIELFELPAVINELKTIGDVIKRRDRAGFYPEEIYIPIPDDMEKYFQHSSAAVNTFLTTITAKYDSKKLSALWEKYIMNPTETNVGLVNLTNSPLINIEEIIMLYLAASNLRKERPSNCAVNNEKYLDTMAQYFKEISNFIAIAEDQYETIVKVGQLVIGIQDNVALLESSQYNKFLDTQMNPESILGLIVTGKRDIGSFMFGDIQAHATEYLEVWHNKVKLDAFNNIERNIKKHKVVYEIVLNELYEKYLPQDLHEYAMDQKGVMEWYATFKEEELGSTITNPDEIARKATGVILCKTFFTDFTNHMLEYKKMNNTITQQDAASFAAIDIILDFLLEQVTDRNLTQIVG